MPAVDGSTLVGLVGEKIESLEKQLERVEKDIAAVERKKLLTIISPGSPDKVLFIQPYDLRGKDPSEDIEEIESYVVETRWNNGFAEHITGKRPTGRFTKRGPIGPFGPTYKIDTGNQNGEREHSELQRVLTTHTSRLARVPEPVSYHTEINELGHLDLKNNTLEKENVPVALLENYEPLNNLLTQKKALEDRIRERDGKPKVAANVLGGL